MLKYDTTKGTITGTWVGCEVDKPYKFTNDKGKEIVGTTTAVFLEGLTRGNRSELFRIRVPEHLKQGLLSMEDKYKTKQVTLNVTIGYSFGKFMIELA